MWSIHQDRPTILRPAPGKRRFSIELWVQVETEDGYRLDEVELVPKKPLRITDISGMAADELCKMLAGQTVLDAGFKVYEAGKK